MNLFNIFTTIKEVNDKQIRIEKENEHLKESIKEFSNLFKDTVNKLVDKNRELERENARLEKEHYESITSLKAEIEILKGEFDTLVKQAIFDKINSMQSLEDIKGLEMKN